MPTNAEYKERNLKRERVHTNRMAAMRNPLAKVMMNALDQACHGRRSFAFAQMAEALGLEDDEDYKLVIEREHKRDQKRDECLQNCKDCHVVRLYRG